MKTEEHLKEIRAKLGDLGCLESGLKDEIDQMREEMENLEKKRKQREGEVRCLEREERRVKNGNGQMILVLSDLNEEVEKRLKVL